MRGVAPLNNPERPVRRERDPTGARQGPAAQARHGRRVVNFHFTHRPVADIQPLAACRQPADAVAWIALRFADPQKRATQRVSMPAQAAREGCRAAVPDDDAKCRTSSGSLPARCLPPPDGRLHYRPSERDTNNARWPSLPSRRCSPSRAYARRFQARLRFEKTDFAAVFLPARVGKASSVRQYIQRVHRQRDMLARLSRGRSAAEAVAEPRCRIGMRLRRSGPKTAQQHGTNSQCQRPKRPPNAPLILRVHRGEK